MRASLHTASDWIYIPLADSQRSPVSVMVEKQSGSTVRFRTCNPSVDSSEISGLFSLSTCGCRRTERMRKGRLGSAKQWAMCDESTVCCLHISDAATGNAWLCVAAVVAAALGHKKDLSSSLCAPCGILRLMLDPSRAAAVVSCGHLSNGHARDGCRAPHCAGAHGTAGVASSFARTGHRTLKSDSVQAQLVAEADENLSNRGLAPVLTAKQSRAKANDLLGRVEMEEERQRIAEDSAKAQIAAAESPSATLAKIVQTAKLKAEIKVAETQARDVHIGQVASIRFDQQIVHSDGVDDFAGAKSTRSRSSNQRLPRRCEIEIARMESC